MDNLIQFGSWLAAYSKRCYAQASEDQEAHDVWVKRSRISEEVMVFLDNELEQFRSQKPILLRGVFSLEVSQRGQEHFEKLWVGADKLPSFRVSDLTPEDNVSWEDLDYFITPSEELEVIKSLCKYTTTLNSSIASHDDLKIVYQAIANMARYTRTRFESINRTEEVNVHAVL